MPEIKGDTERGKHAVFSWNSKKVSMYSTEGEGLEKEFQAGFFI